MPRSSSRVGWLLATLLMVRSASGAPAPIDLSKELTADDCVAIALQRSASIAEAKAKVSEFEARLAVVEAVYYPKLQGIGFVAPMFTVEGSALTPDVTRKWRSIRDWGPYAFLQALLAWPVYSFGRVEAGATAARERALVEEARVRETKNVVALETRKMYYLHLFARSMIPSVENASDLLTEAIELAQKAVTEGDGAVTQVDVAKLRYASGEVRRRLREAKDGVELSLAALKHTMGLAESTPLKLAEAKLDDPNQAPISLRDALTEAAQNRPEWAQLSHGLKATQAWEEAEALANWPIVFVAGQFRAAWAPSRTNSPNPYHFDPFNEVFGGVAVGIQFDIDPAAASAKADIAHATGEQVVALKHFAATGIPLQVQKAHQEMQRFYDVSEITSGGVKATRQWMTFAAAAYKSGTGEARDLVEGLVAYLTAKYTHYEVLQGYHTAHAQLLQATGHDTKPPES